MTPDILAQRTGHHRPPWTTEGRVREFCTGCNACVEQCPESILIGVYAGTPAIDFSKGECTFCGTCATACPEEVFLDTTTKPWSKTATITTDCLHHSGVSCQLCTDSCPYDALSLDLSYRPHGRPVVTAEACVGCGACVEICPADAVRIAGREKAA